jgi:hypothetical protein
MKRNHQFCLGLYTIVLFLPTIGQSAESVISTRKCAEDQLEKCETKSTCEQAGGFFLKKTCLSLPMENDEGTYLTAQGKQKETEATFWCGVSLLESEYVKEADLFLSQPISVACNVKVASDHVGKTANLVVFADYESLLDTPKTGQAESSWMVDNSAGDFSVLAWDADPTTLVPLQEKVKLTERVAAELYSGLLLASSYLDVFFGYQLENGDIVHSTSPIDMTIYPAD